MLALQKSTLHIKFGAQGLNTSLRDVSELLRLYRDTPNSLGTAEFLKRYEQARAKDIRWRAHIIDLYNRLCRSDLPALQDVRSAGLKLVHNVTPLRRSIMRAGMGS